jgi:hypothetical protein
MPNSNCIRLGATLWIDDVYIYIYIYILGLQLHNGSIDDVYIYIYIYIINQKVYLPTYCTN